MTKFIHLLNKKWSIALLLLACIGLSTSTRAEESDEKDVKSKIKKVTVFLSGAQVTRTGSFYLKPGPNKIIMEGVSPYIDGNTLQAKGVGDFTIMDVVFETHYPQPNQSAQPVKEMPVKIKRSMKYLRDSIAQVSLKLEELGANKEVYDMERKMLLNNGTVKGTGKVNDSIPLLKDAMTFFRSKMTEINMALFKIKKQQDKLNKQLNGMNARMSDLNNWRQHNQMVENPPSGPVYRIVTTINADKSVQGKLDVSYIVTQAGWKPSYDLKAPNMNSPIELSYKAEIHQNSGVDWARVPLTLSTGNPYSSHEKPVLGTWYLNYYTHNPGYYNNKKEAYNKGRAESAKAEEAELLFDMNTAVTNTVTNGVANYQAQKNTIARNSMDYTAAVENMVSAEYKINLPYTIESNNKPHMVAVMKKTLKANYELAVVPKLDRNAFLVANVVDWEDLNLVPAKARIYYDGTYVGQSYIDPIAMQDTLKLAMGRDNSITAVRKKLKDKEKERVIGDNKLKETYYELTLKNAHGYSVNVVVEDHVPVSNNEDIKVEILEKDKAKLNEYTGILTWKFKMKGGGSEKLGFAYSVKFDKNKTISML